MTTAEPSKRPDSTADVDATDSADDMEKLRRQLEELGYKQPVFRDESLAPEVDHDLVRALVRRDCRRKRHRWCSGSSTASEAGTTPTRKR